VAKEARRKFWGWGVDGQGPDEDNMSHIATALASRFDCQLQAPVPVPRIEEIDLAPPRIKPPASMAGIFSAEPYERAGHTYGKA
jgi:alkyldihydroxyacetonephosphate synthase